MKTDGNDLAAAFIRSLSWEELPREVREKARICLLDDLGAVLAGTAAPVSALTARYAAERLPGEEAAILLQDLRASAAGAAMANAYAGNALDIDDGSAYTRGHPGAQVFPTALGLAEKTGAGGRALMEALVAGYEVALLAGRCWHRHHRVYQACGSWGSVACAAVAGRLLGLSHEQLKHALGIAEYHAPNLPMMRDVDHPAMVKHGIGWGAMTGVMAAELAERGFTGVPGLLGFREFQPWVRELGRRFLMMDGVAVKRWCSCGWGHPAMIAAERLAREQAIDAARIASVTVYTFEQARRLFRGRPRSTEEAQFSLTWPLAALLVDGEVGPGQILEDRLSDPRIGELAGRIEVLLDPEIDRRFQLAHDGVDKPEACWGSRVVIRLADGRQYDSGLVREEPGGPGTATAASPWDQAAIREKFRWITASVLAPAAAARVADLAWGLDEADGQDRLGQLVRCCSVKEGP